MNVVSEGVRDAIKDVADIPLAPPAIEQANAVLGLQSSQPDLLAQMSEMREAMNQMQHMLLAPRQPEPQPFVPPQQQFQPYQQQYSAQPQMMQQYMPPHQNYQMQQPFQPQFQQQFQQRNFQPQNQQQNQMRTRIDKYCWTHGGCGHQGKKCKHKAQGHQDNATFRNKMGGSTAYCWNQSWRFRMVEHPNTSNLNVTPNFINITSQSTVIPPKLQPFHNVTAKCDSGASKHYFTVNDQRALTSIQTVSNGPRVGLPDGSIVQGSQAGYMKLHPALTSHAQKAHIFPCIKSSSLISIGQLCDDGCTVVLNNKEIGIYKNNTIILRGKRNFTDGLWDITIPTPDSLPTQFANVIIRQDKTKFELASYLHVCAFSPIYLLFKQQYEKAIFLHGLVLKVSILTRFYEQHQQVQKDI